MDIINVTCGEIQTPVGFLYVIQSVILNQTLCVDSDQSWYLQDGLKIADPSEPQTLIAPVISVSSDRLVTSHCVNELHHEIICDSSDRSHSRRETIFRARNQTAATPNSDVLNEVTPDLQLPDQWWWISALIVIVLLVLICFLLRKRIFRCFQKEEQFIRQCDAPDNKDLEMV
ncbi:hypothetical protein G5714_004054 [Onychostoma macrolepis]|uniref:Uncharacterized protein n=1 Tax=Onychostoma macrolepis TaxID=369639 RepID=A0A7J6DC19_9TELE|nr:hypothetical protein G5714_004054 [Onychostoma macrolepis]